MIDVHENRFGAWAQLYARIALASGLLSAVADRFGLWGRPGAQNVAWGDFAQFVTYTGTLNPLVPHAFLPALAVAATVCELLFGFALLFGIFTRYAALGSAVLLAVFGLAMTASLGIKKPLDFSVFIASAAALLLACSPSYSWSVDHWRIAGRSHRRQQTR